RRWQQRGGHFRRLCRHGRKARRCRGGRRFRCLERRDRRTAWLPVPVPPGRTRTDQGGALDRGRAGLPGRRPRARVPAGSGTRPVCHGRRRGSDRGRRPASSGGGHTARNRVGARPGVGDPRRRHRGPAQRLDRTRHALRARRQGRHHPHDGGGAVTKLLMPYITAGVRPNWTTYLTAFEDAGADLIEVGLPFSDPTVDGPTIQEASDAALTRGATPASVLAELAAIRVSVPLIASTYANIALRPGFADALRAAGVTGLIVPDLPLEELAGLSAPGIEVSLLASPATPDERLAEIGRRSQGFVYAVSVMGTTGERDRLAPSAAALAARVKKVTGLPVLLGFGISTPEQAAEAAAVADGVIVGAAIMRRILNGDSPAEVGLFVASLRAALSGAIAVR